MEECPFDGDDHREFGDAALIHHHASDILIANNQGPPGNAKRLALTGNKKDQP
jgi:hypothetical protein